MAMSNSPRLSLESYRLEILSNALTALTEEIQITLLRSAYSQVVKEAQDASCAIFTAEGRIVAQPVVIPGHLGSMKFMLAEVLKDIPAETLAPGDVLVSNDPYRGGSHLPDIARVPADLLRGTPGRLCRLHRALHRCRRHGSRQ